MTQHEDEQAEPRAKKPRLNLTTSQVAASALAACCASIVASYLGVAGTVIGAAVGSVIATTGAAIWGHLFRTGGDKIKQTLLVNGEPVEVEVERADADAASPASVAAGRFYGADAATEAVDLWHPKTPTAETQLIDVDDQTRVIPASGGSADVPPVRQRVAFKKYRKPMGIAAAIIAVFSISIVVGLLAGAPVRSAGSANSPGTTTTTTVTDTETKQTRSQASEGSSASSGSSASPSASSKSSASSSASSSATPSSSASSSASPDASSSGTSAATQTGQAQAGGATSTGSTTP